MGNGIFCWSKNILHLSTFPLWSFQIRPHPQSMATKIMICHFTPYIWSQMEDWNNACFHVLVFLSWRSHCSTCLCSRGWFSTTICLNKCWRSVRAIQWVYYYHQHIQGFLQTGAGYCVVAISTRKSLFLLFFFFCFLQINFFSTDSESVLTGQEEHSFHAGAALSVCPHGGLHSQVRRSVCCCGVTARGLQDQWGPTGRAHIQFTKISDLKVPHTGNSHLLSLDWLFLRVHVWEHLFVTWWAFQHWCTRINQNEIQTL